jgi:putative ATP-grasp target RiPP
MGNTTGETVVGSNYEEFNVRSVDCGEPLTVSVLSLGERITQEAGRDLTPNVSYSIPFGLTRVTVPQVHGIDLGEASYDPVRQITVMPDGTPFIDEPSMKSTLYCTTTTTEDMQSWPDTVADGTD